MTDGRGERPPDRSAAHPSLVPAGRDRPARPADLVEQPGWRRLLAAARRSLERTGGRLDTTVTLSDPDDDERLVIIGITGTHRSAAAARLSVRLSAVDEHLHAAHGVGLIEVLTTTAPLRNRPSDLKREAVARDAVLAVAHEGRHAGTAWYAEWLDGLRRDGTLTRIVRTGLPFEEVIRVLDALPAADEPIPVFADRVLDDTKALTDGPLRGLVLRAVAAWQQTALPVGGERERALWESVGLVPDDLASQVLVLNAPATGGLVGRWLTEAAQAGVPIRVTLHQLRLAPLTMNCDEVYVCENPAVLRAATTALGAQAPPLICTEGVPSVAVHTLLGTAHRAVIRWRNDFDWIGVRLTAAALQRYPGAVPWRMTAADYLPAAGTGTALLGTPTETPWDHPLGESMRQTGRAVMEERLLDRLLADLRLAGAG
ncbi:TIGR02679 domain-containing protein [Micromonospora marina]|uniref:TIGR02679 family protein n=1 Tax=Micromonospora marina TaxID=307120 RepID=A0A1C5AFN2_9ACTN|nr:TIGR02679 domain-containing protein [Micromonospora marina]SCF44038.1 TIGR02679 family protein [Micromonospora marina]